MVEWVKGCGRLTDRLPEESNYDYVKRLVYGKSDGIYDIDYTELFKLLFNTELSSNESRKRYYGIKMLLDNLGEEVIENISDDEILDKFELQRIEFEKEKMRFQDQRREYTKLIRETARFEHIKDELIKAIKESTLPELEFNPREYISNDKHGVLLLSDWHTGLKTNNHWNKYSIDEFHKRIEKLIEKTIEHGKFHNIDTLHIFGLGDFIHGLIHVSNRVASEESVTKQTMRATETLAQMICVFANTFNNIEFHITTGNHGRMVPNKQDSINEENFEEFILWYLKARLQNLKNVKLNENTYDEGIIVGNVLGYNCLAVHGDKDKITSVVQDLTLMLKLIPHYVFTADKHHLEENEIHGVEVVINRSLSGVDDYSKNIRKTSKAGQCFMIFNKEDGRECTYPIKLN